MNDRIKELRKSLGLSGEKFGERVGVKRNTVSQWETGTNSVTDQMFKSICREFNVNEEWLRTGEGEMFNLPEDETAALVSELLDESSPVYDLVLSIVKTYQKLDVASKEVLDHTVLELFNNMQTKTKKED